MPRRHAHSAQAPQQSIWDGEKGYDLRRKIVAQVGNSSSHVRIAKNVFKWFALLHYVKGIGSVQMPDRQIGGT